MGTVPGTEVPFPPLGGNFIVADYMSQLRAALNRLGGRLSAQGVANEKQMLGAVENLLVKRTKEAKNRSPGPRIMLPAENGREIELTTEDIDATALVRALVLNRRPNLRDAGNVDVYVDRNVGGFTAAINFAKSLLDPTNWGNQVFGRKAADSDKAQETAVTRAFADADMIAREDGGGPQTGAGGSGTSPQPPLGQPPPPPVNVNITHLAEGDLTLHVHNAQATARARVQTANDDLRRLESRRAELLAGPATDLADDKGEYQQTLQAIDHARGLLLNATGQLWATDPKDPDQGTVAKQAAVAAVAAEQAAAYPLWRQASQRKAAAAPAVAPPAAAPVLPPEPPPVAPASRPQLGPSPMQPTAAAAGPSVDAICDALLDGLLSGLERQR